MTEHDTEVEAKAAAAGIGYDPTKAWAELVEKYNLDPVATQTLPATQKVIPASVTYGKVKKSRLATHNREQDASYSIEILVKGTLVGWAEDEGYGGGFHFVPKDVEGRRAEDRVQAEAWVLAGRPSFYLHETLYADLAEEWQTFKTLSTKVKNGKKTPCLNTETPAGVLQKTGDESFSYDTPTWVEVNRSLQWCLDNAALLKKDGINFVWSGTDWKAL